MLLWTERTIRAAHLLRTNNIQIDRERMEMSSAITSLSRAHANVCTYRPNVSVIGFFLVYVLHCISWYRQPRRSALQQFFGVKYFIYGYQEKPPETEWTNEMKCIQRLWPPIWLRMSLEIHLPDLVSAFREEIHSDFSFWLGVVTNMTINAS